MAKRKINHQWERVYRTPIPAQEQLNQEMNKRIFNSEWFKGLCKLLDIKPTHRQASKYNNKKGLVFKNRHLKIPLLIKKAVKEM